MPRTRAFAIFSLFPGLALLLVGGATLALSGSRHPPPAHTNQRDAAIHEHADDLMEQGRNTFPNDTFGKEGFFGAIGLAKAVGGTKVAGVVKTVLGLVR